MLTLLESQLSTLLPVISVHRLDRSSAIYREFLLVKVRAEDKDARDEIIQIANIFRASVVDISKNTLMLQLSGDSSKTEAILKLLGDFGIMEMARTGMIALERGENTIYDLSKAGAEYESGK
jgi:acetolactate synthase-1/3 small subunit